MPRFPLPPPERSSSEWWGSPAFEAELRAWVEGVVGPVRLERHKLRAWSTVWRAYGGSGLFWAKQNAPGSRFEAALLWVLGRIVPEHVVPVTAVDLDRGLILLPDQGSVLGFEHADIATWSDIVRQWAVLQRELLSHTQALLDAGVTGLWLEDSEALLLDRSAALHALPERDPRRLAAEPLRRIHDELPDVREAVDVVGALGLPPALNHNDLHGNNVFAHRGEALRFFDLGDAVIGDSMGVLLVPLGCLAEILGCSPDDPRLWQVAEAWLEVWSDVAPIAEMRRVLPHAMRLARLARHEAWVRIMPGMTAVELADWATGGSEWLAVVPDPPLLAAAAVAAAPAGF